MTEKKRDRLSMDLMGLRERLESVAVEPGQPLSSVLRRVALLGVELLEVCTKLKMPQPQIGQLEEWLRSTVRVLEAQENNNQASELIKFLSSPNRPSDVEIVKIASQLKIDTEELMNICDRLYSKEHCANGH